METRSDAAAWLGQAEGFAVESGGSRVGVVDHLRNGAAGGVSPYLIVRAGRFGRRRMLISVDDVREILPRQRRILLHPTWMTISV